MRERAPSCGPHPKPGCCRQSPGHAWHSWAPGRGRTSLRRLPPGPGRGAIPALKSVTGRPGLGSEGPPPPCSPRKRPDRPQPRHWERGRLTRTCAEGASRRGADRTSTARSPGGSYHLSLSTSLAAAQTAQLGQRPGSARRTWKWRHGGAREAPPTNSSRTPLKFGEGRAEL